MVANTGVNAALPNGDPFTPIVAAPTVAMPLSKLSVPLHEPTVGVTVYCQLPGGTSSSAQLMEATVPLHVPIGLMVATPPPAG